MDWQDTITGDDATEALASAWASMAGDLGDFEKGKLGSDTGRYYVGYLSDANDLRKRLLERGYVIVAQNP